MERGLSSGGGCQGKVALVTGASRGIGQAIVQRLAAEGAAVAVLASTLGPKPGVAGSLAQTLSELEASGARATAIVADLASIEARADLAARVADRLGPIDILVNNAAVTGVWAPPSRCDLASRRHIFEVNYHAPIDLIQQALPHMLASQRGWILNLTSSTATQTPLPYRGVPDAVHAMTVYGSSKAALDRYTIGLAHELSATGVRVNALAPTKVVVTQGADAFSETFRAQPDMVEPIELLVEAVLALVTGPYTGQVVTSRAFLHGIQRPFRSLDGCHVLGDAGTRVASLDVGEV